MTKKTQSKLQAKDNEVNDSYDGKVTFPFAVMGIRTMGLALIGLDFLPKNSVESFAETATGKQTWNALIDYLDDPTKTHEVVLASEGTEYQKRVWNAIRDIPIGEVRTYSELAFKLDSSPRAVANACRRNKIPLLIPCHRVIAKKGLGGYFGQTKGEMYWVSFPREKHRVIALNDGMLIKKPL